MKTISKIIISITVLLSLTGCLYGQCINGSCAFERAEIIANIKPYGAHWIKEGMTRETRLQDLASCGNSRSLSPGFPDALIREETLSTDAASPRSYNKDLIDNPQAEERLGEKRMLCMQAKGYRWLDNCDISCLYP